MKKKIAIFVVGFIFGVCALGAVLAVKKSAEDLKSWGQTEVCSDSQVRQAIKDGGIDLPHASWDLFHAISGFQDHDVWITFTVPRNQLWSVVEASIHKKRENFISGIPKEFVGQVEFEQDQKIDTSLWNLKGIKNPLHFSIRKKSSYLEDWVVDEENGRVFITRQNL